MITKQRPQLVEDVEKLLVWRNSKKPVRCLKVSSAQR